MEFLFGLTQIIYTLFAIISTILFWGWYPLLGCLFLISLKEQFIYFKNKDKIHQYAILFFPLSWFAVSIWFLIAVGYEEKYLPRIMIQLLFLLNIFWIYIMLSDKLKNNEWNPISFIKINFQKIKHYLFVWFNSWHYIFLIFAFFEFMGARTMLNTGGPRFNEFIIFLYLIGAWWSYIMAKLFKSNNETPKIKHHKNL